MTAGDDLTALVRQLGRPAAVCRDLDPTTVELRQERWLGPLEVTSGPQARRMHAALVAPRLLARYPGSRAVVTFYDDPARDYDLAARLYIVLQDVGYRFRSVAQLDTLTIDVDGRRHPAHFATTVDQTPILTRWVRTLVCLVAKRRRPRRYATISGPGEMQAYGARIDETRTVVVAGRARWLRDVHLRWVSP